MASNFYIIYSQQPCWLAVCRAELFVSVWDFVYEDTKLFSKPWITFSFFASSFCDILGVNTSCFHLWVSLPPSFFFYFMCVCLCFHWFLYACKFWNFSALFPFIPPLNCRCLWSLFIICYSWFAQYQKAQKRLFIRRKWQPPIFVWANVNNVYQHPISFVFLDRVWNT